MLENALSAVATVTIPALGLFLRGSRRNRIRSRISDYITLSEQFANHDDESAEKFRRLASEAASTLVLREERWLNRRLDPTAAFAILLLTLPAAAAFAWAWTWDSDWRLPVLIFTAAWTAFWGIGGTTQLWHDHASSETESS